MPASRRTAAATFTSCCSRRCLRQLVSRRKPSARGNPEQHGAKKNPRTRLRRRGDVRAEKRGASREVRCKRTKRDVELVRASRDEKCDFAESRVSPGTIRVENRMNTAIHERR